MINFSVGDKVIFINESREGVVVHIKNSNFLIINSNGLDFDVSINDVIKVTQETEDFYQKIRKNIFCFKNNVFENNILQKTDRSIKDFKIDISKNFELDLHIEKIIESFVFLSSRDILDIQMDVFFKGLFKANRLNLDFIIIIHGVGKGVLKKKIIDFLKENNASFLDEKPMIYHGGATRINLH